MSSISMMSLRTIVTCHAEPSSSAATVKSAKPKPLAASRRSALLGACLLTLARGPARASQSDDDVFADAPPAPLAGDGPDAVGEMNGFLNSCPSDVASCVSSQNDDKVHFTAPWAYEGDRSLAMRRLVAVATGVEAPRGRAGAKALKRRGRGGGALDASALDENGFNRGEVAAFIVGTTRAFVTGEELPDKPTRVEGFAVARGLSFAARVEEYDETRGYVRLILAPKNAKAYGTNDDDSVEDNENIGGGYFDAEFLFIDDDELVDVRVAQRLNGNANAAPAGRFQLSYDEGISFNKNIAALRAEELRIAVGWELIPVI
mmetsp:Transcript_2037/g.6659  ORF Transcript_2037/g.6659 Transcript_2037/m.6659 type:complete len:318 (-) Transcript_2037:36-989(-)